LFKLVNAPLRLSRSLRSITLYPAIVYMFNALSTRPAEGRAESDLLSVCLPRRQAEPEKMDSEDDDEVQFITFNPYGIFFFCGLELNPCARLPPGRKLQPRSYPVLLGGERDELVSTMKNALLQRPPRGRAPDHLSNKSSHTRIFRPNGDDEELMNGLRAELEDIQFPANIFGHDEEDGGNFADSLIKIFMQFRSDVLQKSPLSKTKRNYLKLDVDRLNPAPEVFTDKILSRYWICIQYKRSHLPEWKTNIENLFPIEVGAIKT
jgi:hypothetical protein